MFVSFRSVGIENKNVPTLARCIEKATSAGFQGLYCDYHPKILDAMDRTREEIRRKDFGIYPVVPNVTEYVRDISHGFMYTGLKRLRRLSPTYLLRIVARAIAHPGGVLSRDLRVLFPLMLEMELARFASYRPRFVFLHAQMTDLLLATRARELFAVYSQIVRSQYDAEPALETNNYYALANALVDWGLKFGVLAAPLNPKGYRMKPSKMDYEQLLAASETAFFARDITAGGSIPASLAIEYVKQKYVDGIILEGVKEDTVSEYADALGYGVPRKNT